MKKMVVLGSGESGVGAALLGKQKGYKVFVSDKGTILKKYKKILIENDIEFEQNNHTKNIILNADLLVKSPGIPNTIPIIREIEYKKIPIISEIEFASQFTDATIVGITGSNGKTTNTTLIYYILKREGLNVGISGNIGNSFAKQVASKSHKNYVLELSSFQLDNVYTSFHPHIAVITNITPDHLDRYEYDFKKYIASKFRIIKNQTEHDFLIYDADDQNINKWLKNNSIKSNLVPFSVTKELDYGAFLKDGNITINLNTQQFTMSISKLTLRGKHNIKNAMAATMTAQLLKIRKQTIKECLSDFEGVEHRLEHVQKINGVQFINDSKATNVNATFYALESIYNPIIWIVGGQDKGNDYTSLLPLVHEKVKGIICLGVDNHKIKQTFKNVVDILIETTKVEQAVKIANKMSQKGDVVLLSPACASFDLFKNYEERGRKFKEAIQNL